MRKQFDIKYRPQIESGEYKVVLDCGVEAEILAWDKPGEYPIVCMAKKEGAIPFRADNNGIAYHYPEGSNYSNLFIVTPEPKLTELEERLVKFYNDFNGLPHDKDGVYNRHDVYELLHNTASELLTLARKESQDELIKFKVAAETGYNTGREDGKAEALKDLPRWRKCADCTPKPKYSNEWIFSIDSENVTRESAIVHKGYFLPLDGLEKLPGFKED